MDITFEGKYKSITNFSWIEVPNFVIITGANGTGKSQLLDLLYNTITRRPHTVERVSIIGKEIQPNEITYLKGEWQLQRTGSVSLYTIQQELDSHYNNLKSGSYTSYNNPTQTKLFYALQNIITTTGKSHNLISKQEFIKHFPDLIIDEESQQSQKISQLFYNYRLSEIECQAKQMTSEQIRNEIGHKPWEVLREIIKESKLLFDINDPSECGLRDDFRLELTHQISKEKIEFNDLSSGEKVLVSLVFYLYNSQEKKYFPKLLLMDEPDAHLHPSMSQQFLNVVKNVLVDMFGVQVIMTTHSPSTLILAPLDSIFEMSITEPRIKKSTSKNHSVTLLTAGLVYVGEGTKYYLVEDQDDVDFYSYVYGQLTINNIIESDIPLVFIPASTKGKPGDDKSGGKNVVSGWVNKLQASGLENILQGLIDADYDNEVGQGLFKINRYSIENYLIDPIIIYATLVDREKAPYIDGINISIGEEYKLKTMPDELLQKIADVIFALIEPTLIIYFSDFDQVKESEKTKIVFSNGSKLMYPKWALNRRGKTLLNQVCNNLFSGSVINRATLFKSLKKLKIFPNDLADKISSLR